MTMKWSFSYNFFVKLSLYNMIHFEHGSFGWTPNIVLKGTAMHSICTKKANAKGPVKIVKK